MRFRWEAVTNTWNQWVLGYDPQRQREVLSRLGLREPDWKAMTAVMAVLCGFLLLGLTAWALHKRVRLDPTLGAWNRLSRKLARVGLARKDWEGPDGLRPSGGACPPGTGDTAWRRSPHSISTCAMAN